MLGTEHIGHYEKEYTLAKQQLEREIAAHEPGYSDAKATLEDAREAKRAEISRFRALLDDRTEQSIFDKHLANRSFPPKFTDKYIEDAAARHNMDTGQFRRILDDLTSRFQTHKQETWDWIDRQSALVEDIELSAKKALYATEDGKAFLNQYYDKELGYILSKWDYFPSVTSNASSVTELLYHNHSRPEKLIDALSGSQHASYDWRYLAKQAQELSACTGEPVSATLRQRLQRIGMKPEFVELYTDAVEAFKNGNHNAHLEALYAQHAEALESLERKTFAGINATYNNHHVAPTATAPHASAAEPTAAQAEESMSWLKRLLYSRETGRIHGGKAAGLAAAALATGAGVYALTRRKDEEKPQQTWVNRTTDAPSDTSKGIS